MKRCKFSWTKVNEWMSAILGTGMLSDPIIAALNSNYHYNNPTLHAQRIAAVIAGMASFSPSTSKKLYSVSDEFLAEMAVSLAESTGEVFLLEVKDSYDNFHDGWRLYLRNPYSYPEPEQFTRVNDEYLFCSPRRRNDGDDPNGKSYYSLAFFMFHYLIEVDFTGSRRIGIWPSDHKDQDDWMSNVPEGVVLTKIFYSPK